jgi:hypothetical protein
MQAYENETLHMFSKTIGDKSCACVCVCVCARARVCVLRIPITKDKILPFSNYKVRMYSFLQKYAAHLKPSSVTTVSEHWSVPG